MRSGNGAKVLHVPYCYYPDPVGGTEVYVASLARIQQAGNYEVAIAAPAAQNRSYLHDGLPVHRFEITKKPSLRQIYSEGDPAAAASFQEILDRFRPNVLHLHAFTGAVSAPLVQLARSRKIPVVFTYHTPAVTCCRGTMLKWGNLPCDGEMRVNRCASCMLHGKGLPANASRLLGNIPPAIGALAGTAGLEGGMWTAFRSTELVGVRQAAVKQFLEETDHIFAVCEWVRAALLINGIPSGKITLSRQGTSHPFATAGASSGRGSSPVRLAFLGRADPAKGLQVLMEAMALLRDVDLRLDVFVVAQSEEARMQADLLSQRRNDHRVRFLEPLNASDVTERLANYDALMVPSQGLETGPLVVYEGFAAGIPVIGSALGGIAELVANEVNGLLIDPPGSAKAWADGIRRFVSDAGLLQLLKAAPKPVRTAENSAEEVAEVYASLLQRGASRAGLAEGIGS